MAKIFLDTTDTTFNVNNNNTTVYGATGSQTVVVAAGLTGVTLDSNVEGVQFSGATTDYKYLQVGTNQFQVVNAAGVVVANLGLDAATESLTFANGTVPVKIVPVTGAAPAITIGGTTVSTTAAAPVSIPTANIDASHASVPTPTFSVVGAASATEGGNALFTVTLANPSATTATTVNYTLANLGGATGADTTDETIAGTGVTGVISTSTAVDGPYLGSLTFAPGATTATISLPIVLDTIAETGEAVSLTLSNPSAGVVNSAGAVVTTALLDAPAPTFTMTSNAVAGVSTQEGRQITFTVTPNSVVNAATTLNLNIIGQALNSITATTATTDFSAVQPITFAVGATAPQTVTVTVANDGKVDGIRAYDAQLLNSTFSKVADVAGTITDPVPTITLASAAASVNEGSSVTLTATSDTVAPVGGYSIPYTLSSGTNTGTTGGAATIGTDYYAGATANANTTGNIVIAAGATTGTLVLNAIADNTTEGAETLTVTPGSIAGLNIVATPVALTIADSSTAPAAGSVSLAAATAAVNEGSSDVFTITLGTAAPAGGLTIPYTLAGTASNVSTNYTVSPTGNFTFAAGVTTASVTLAAVADSVTEGAQTVALTLGTLPTGYSLAAGTSATNTVTINDTSIAVTGSNFSLTSAVDNITGTTGNDTIIADNSSAANKVTSAADAIDGGAGVDTLKIYEDATATVTNLPTITGVESLYVNNDAAGLDLSNIAGIVTLTLDAVKAASSKTYTLTGQTVTLSNQTAANTYTLASTTDTAENITLSKIGTATAATVAVTGTKVATVAITSTGTLTANTANSITLTDITGVKVDTITVAGSSDLNLTVGDALAATPQFAATGIKSIDASAATGKTYIDVNSTATSANTDIATLFSYKGGSGADTLDLSAAAISGVVITAAQLNKLTIDAGTGSDTVVVSDAIGTGSTAITSLTNVENIGVYFAGHATNVINMANFATATGLKLFGADAAAVTVSSLASNGIFDEGTSTQAANNVSVSAAGTGTSDILAWTLGSATAAFGGGLLGTNTISGYETINLTSQGAANTLSTGAAIALNASAGGNETLNLILTKDLTASAAGSTLTLSGVSTAINVSGAGALSLGGVITSGTLTDTGTGVVTASAVNKVLNADFSAVTGAVTFNDSGATAGVVLKGGNGGVTFTGAGLADVISVGSGANSVTGGAGADNIAINHNGVNNVTTLIYAPITGTNDTGAAITANGALTGVDVITGAAKGDTINLSQASGSITNALAGAYTSPVAAGTASTEIVRGTYNTGTGAFTASTSGTDSLVQWADGMAGHLTAAIVLVGYADSASTSISGTTGLITLAQSTVKVTVNGCLKTPKPLILPRQGGGVVNRKPALWC